MTLAYRPEIDGMRAIAVMSVMVYHLDIDTRWGPVLPGGFFGVDLFFVLSGFLIAQILVLEYQGTGTISFVRFYARRARRILPPLILVMLCALPPAWFLLTDTELARFAWSILAALSFVSNFFWFVEQGTYGAASGLLQPFLHTWSLSIEEQFYLFFPLLLLLVLKRGSIRTLFVVMVMLLLTSLIVSQLTTTYDENLSFFSPFSRAWEMLAGACLAVVAVKRPGLWKTKWLMAFVPSLCLGSLIICFALLQLNSIAHPGLVTVPIVLCSCGLLWFAGGTDPVTCLLRSGPMVWIGKLSYSLYLWHFPVFAFGRLMKLDAPGPLDMTLWMVVTFALAAAGYRWVETPFRYRLPPVTFRWALGGATGVCAAAMCALAFGIAGPTPITRHLQPIYGNSEIDNEKLRDDTWAILAGLSPTERIDVWNAARPSKHERHGRWFTSAETRNVLIIGNSHSKDLYNAFVQVKENILDTSFARFAVDGALPESQIAQLQKAPNFRSADVILIATRYTKPTMDRLPDVIETLKRAGKDVVIIGNTAEFTPRGHLPVFDAYVRQFGPGWNPGALARHAYEQERPHETLDTALRDIAAQEDVAFWSRRDLICSDVRETCDLVLPDGRKVMYDNSHWTMAGAKFLGQRALDMGWFHTDLSAYPYTYAYAAPATKAPGG